MGNLCYTSKCLDECFTGRFALSNAINSTQYFIVGKAPRISGLTSRHSSRQRWQANAGRFVMSQSGIYCIECLSNNKVYIGSSINIPDRISHHFGLLNRNSHHNIYLQRAWDLYGEGSFRFFILEIIDKVELLAEKEQEWIDVLDTTSRGNGFNIAPRAGHQMGYRHSEEAKQKISKSSTGRKFPKEIVDKRVATLRQRGIKPTAECLMRAAQSKKEKGVSVETREAISLSLKGKKQTEEHTKKRIAKIRKTYKLTSPGGQQFIVTNLAEFCSAFDLLGCKICDVCRGRRKHHKGWTAEYA